MSQTETYEAIVSKRGTVNIPAYVKKKYGLSFGSKVKVTLHIEEKDNNA